MPPITTISTFQEQPFDTNEKGNELLSVIPTIDTSPLRSNTVDDDVLSISILTLDEADLHRVFLSSEHILLHLDDPTVVESRCQDLWDLGQQLKHLPISSSSNTSTSIYIKAMLWMIYHCRGSIAYHQKEWAHAIHACQTCLAIDLPTHTLKTSESLLLQKVGLMQSQTSSILEKCLVHQQQCRRRSSVVSDDSASSSSGSMAASMMVCSFCAVKKRTMPVCAQCKSQRYCGMKCLKLDKDRHSSHCLQR